MRSIHVRATADVDGELHLRGLPIQKGQHADVIVLTDVFDESIDDEILALLQHDPSWAWLRDPAEDIYTEQDVR